LIQSESEFPAKSKNQGRGFAVKRKRYSVEQTVAILKQAEVGITIRWTEVKDKFTAHSASASLFELEQCLLRRIHTQPRGSD
jgi:hypothetical protein